MADKSKILFMLGGQGLKNKESLVKKCSKFQCCFSSQEENVLEQVFNEVPHLLVIDEDFKSGEGKAAAFEVKEDGILKYIPIILWVENELKVFKEKDRAIDYFVCKDGDGIQRLVDCVHNAMAENTHELDLNPLTRLPGTQSGLLRIERAIHSKKPFAVCFADLSGLSVYNNVYGDSRGDELIMALSRIIQDVAKKETAPGHFVGHLGGDDFVIVTHPPDASRVAEAMIKKFDQTVLSFYDEHDRRQGYLVQKDAEGNWMRQPIMSLSVVIVYSDGKPSPEISRVGHIAGEFKRYMKGLSESGYVEYRLKHVSELNRSEEPLLEIHLPTKMKSVRIAGSKHEPDRYADFFETLFREKNIRTVYQPIAELKTKKVIGYEALTRSLDDRFFNDANLLFSMAHETGRIKQLDVLCIESALKAAQKLGRGQKLFLNLNHETLMDPEIMKDLFRDKGGIGFKNIVIEVTEQSILRSFREMKDVLLELKEQGVSVAIDDVGGGAVSLRDVAVLKPDYIKFDRSLIRQINTHVVKQQILLSLILFAKGIHAVTTAEGIETKEELEAVLMCGIELGQGYYLARPAKPFAELNRNL